ncbi:MAG: copper resistance protein NlpE [Dysgonamonadaceae bacterium]|nr:copper resistance protein NlpE [Dysgonamonadaceae bacterium]
MRKVVYVISIIAVLVLGLDSCKSKGESNAQDEQVVAVDPIHNLRNSTDWNGTYTGTVPCADCPGISVKIALNSDETYQLSYQYLEKEDSVYSASGKFTWDDNGSVITLDCKDWPPYYQVGADKLIQLDMEGNLIPGELAGRYELAKSAE